MPGINLLKTGRDRTDPPLVTAAAALGPSTNSPARVGLPRLCAGFAAIHAIQAVLAAVLVDVPHRNVLITLDATVAVGFALLAFMTKTRRFPGWRREMLAALVPIVAAAAATARIGLIDQPWPAAELILATAAACVVTVRFWFWSVIGACAALWAFCVGIYLWRGQLDQDTGVVWVHMGLLVLVATGMATAVRRTRTGAAVALVDANRQLLEQSVRDPLTGVANRKGLELVARPMIDLARRQGQAVHCLVLDVDTLKDINAEHGTREGDDVLTSVAEALRVATRGTDVVARIGGDEFVMLGPGTGTSPLEMERRVRAHLETVEALPRSAWAGKVSAGSATLVPWDGDDLDGLLERAEQDLALRRSLKRRTAARMRSEEIEEAALADRAEGGGAAPA